jgi:hypothetical protein
MASWLQHPRYVHIREGLVQHLRPPKYRFRRLNPVVFLCGSDGSKGRDALREYLHKYTPNLSVFYAELVWEIIASLGERDALQMEEDLAKLADLVIVLVESPGTFTELGAFSLSPSLRKKMLPIVDEKYRHDVSFITNGPLKWIDSESVFKPTIYTNLDKNLLAADQVQERIQRIAKPHSTKLEDLATSPKASSVFHLRSDLGNLSRYPCDDHRLPRRHIAVNRIERNQRTDTGRTGRRNEPVAPVFGDDGIGDGHILCANGIHRCEPSVPPQPFSLPGESAGCLHIRFADDSRG